MVQIISIRAPVTGVVGDVNVNEGDSVRQGGVLAMQTAGKTETQVSAPLAGRVRNIARKGVALKEGDILAEIEY